MTTNTPFRRQAIRAAVKIHEHLLGPARLGQGLVLPQSAWEDLCRTIERHRYAEDKDWHSASQSLLPDADYAARCLQREIDVLRQSFAARSRPCPIASAGEMAADLMALENEFENVQVDLKAHSVSAVTADMELEGIQLGAFRIVLFWQQIGNANCYRCHAQEPYYSGDRQDVTHPHVQDDHLCEGEGAVAIKAALSAGRLYDFFVLVRQILSTYNSESAHVQLSEWNGGISCYGCGCGVSEDDYSCCDRCDERFCSDCSWTCSGCSNSMCSGCSSLCSQCDERFCDSCLTTPEGTTLSLCDKCLQAQNKDPTHDETENGANQPAATPADQTAPAAAAADAVRVGQAAVSPRPGRNGSRRVRCQPARRPAARRGRTSGAASVHAGNG
jgi:hypothetical protein